MVIKIRLLIINFMLVFGAVCEFENGLEFFQRNAAKVFDATQLADGEKW